MYYLDCSRFLLLSCDIFSFLYHGVECVVCVPVCIWTYVDSRGWHINLLSSLFHPISFFFQWVFFFFAFFITYFPQVHFQCYPKFLETCSLSEADYYPVGWPDYPVSPRNIPLSTQQFWDFRLPQARLPSSMVSGDLTKVFMLAQ